MSRSEVGFRPSVKSTYGRNGVKAIVRSPQVVSLLHLELYGVFGSPVRASGQQPPDLGEFLGQPTFSSAFGVRQLPALGQKPNCEGLVATDTGNEGAQSSNRGTNSV